MRYFLLITTVLLIVGQGVTGQGNMGQGTMNSGGMMQAGSMMGANGMASGSCVDKNSLCMFWAVMGEWLVGFILLNGVEKVGDFAFIAFILLKNLNLGPLLKAYKTITTNYHYVIPFRIKNWFSFENMMPFR